MTHEGDRGEDHNTAPSGKPRSMCCVPDCGLEEVGGREDNGGREHDGECKEAAEQGEVCGLDDDGGRSMLGQGKGKTEGGR